MFLENYSYYIISEHKNLTFLLHTEHKRIGGSMTGITVGAMTDSGLVTEAQKVWRSFQALGDIAFAYSYSMILIEIQVYSSLYHLKLRNDFHGEFENESGIYVCDN